MAETLPDFNKQYGGLVSDVFSAIAQKAAQNGEHIKTLANESAEKGKPDFALAYLMIAELPDTEKREILARAFEQRAGFSDQKAAEFDAEFHRPFPLISLEAQKDRSAAKAVRAGKPIDLNARAAKPLNAQ